MSSKPEFLGEMLETLNFFTDDFDHRQIHIENLLCRYLNTKTVIAFIGAGTSQPLGYPNWWQFSYDIVTMLKFIFDDSECESEKGFEEFSDKQKSEKIKEELEKEAIKKATEGAKNNKKNLTKALINSIKKAVQNEQTIPYLTNSNITDIKEKINNQWVMYLEVLLQINAFEEKSEGKGEIEKTTKDYDENRKIYKEDEDKKRFEYYLKCIERDTKNEIDALFIFSECERLLCSQEDWGKEKQSKVFRNIIKAYFHHKYENVGKELRKKIIEDSRKTPESSKDIFHNDEYKNLDENEFDALEDKNILLEKYNPYFALSEMPISKFVTPNYDLEIERALLYKKKIQNTEKPIQEDDIFNFAKTDKDVKKSIDKIIEATGKKSFSQVKENHEQLAQFSVSRYEETNFNVFHCHGRIDDFKSCIVSEEDYQKWYLKDENREEFTPFRQTLDLTLDSNPILFMGFGLKDADLMRLLRQITTNRPLNKTRTPLFCLLYVGANDIGKENSESNKKYKWQNEKELKEECTALYIKYGLHVIPVYQEKMKADFGSGDATCHKLIQLKNRWNDWWEGILKKPKFRKSPAKTVTANSPYFHYQFEQGGYIDNVDNRFIQQLHYILETQPSEKEQNSLYFYPTSRFTTQNYYDDTFFANRLAIVVGDGGTGKSWGVQKYLEKYWGESNRKVFFWSAYYSNDVITGIDRLIEYFSDQIKIKDEFGLQKEKFTLLKEIVDDESEKIIVFDGIEKLLVPNNENTEGNSVSPEIADFFRIISHSKNKESRIILTSRIFPIDILYHFDSRINREEKGDTKKYLEDEKLKVRTKNKVTAPKCWVNDLNNSDGYKLKDSNSPFHGIGDEKVSSICSLVDGHIFGVSLISGILATLQNNKDKFDESVDKLIQDIANTPIDRRIQSVIEKAIQNVDKDIFPNSDKAIEKFVERIALFMHPVRKEIAQTCFEEVEKEIKKNPTDKEIKKNPTDLDNLLDKLFKKSIVQKVKINPDGAFVVHPLVRSYIFERIHKSLFASLPSLQLPGFSSGKDIVDPGGEDGKNVAISLFKKLCEEAETKSKDITKQENRLNNLIKYENACSHYLFFLKNERLKIACDMCRAAFSILRSRFCSNTVARWGSYDEYVKLVVKLYDTAKKVSEDFWNYHEPTQNGLEKFCESDTSAPLYADELAWVYNEVGLASLSMGNNLNATALWEQGYEINKLIDRYNPGRYIFQSNFNLGAVNIYYGKLRVAQTHLDKAFEISNKLGNKNLSNRVLGYRALLKYLQGNLEEAETDFVTACEELENNPRAKSLFLCFHGELLLKKQELDKAESLIEQSRNLAVAKYYPDLIAYSGLSKANILLQRKKYSDSQYEFQLVLKTAKEKSLFRLEAATLSGLSRLAEKLGDYQSARLRAIESLKISNEYSLGLHQTVSLLVLGKALVNNSLRGFGIAYLKTARDLAKSQGYFLRLNEAEKELRKYDSDK